MVDLKFKLTQNIKNIPGWRTDRKIVVFISDDWGDKRFESPQNYEELNEYFESNNIEHRVRYDIRATTDDLESLFDVLKSVTDKNGRNAVFTPFTIMATPDFKKIRESSFEKYFYRPFVDDIKSSTSGSSVLDVWDKGFKEKIFIPELHGRDHLNVMKWLNALQLGDKYVHNCFDLSYAYYKSDSMSVSPVLAFFYENSDEFNFLENSLCDGINLFEKAFKRKPTVFNPPNGMFHTSFYKILKKKGVQTISSNHFQAEPNGKGGIKRRYHRFGEVSKDGVVHFISNAAFEPSSFQYRGIKDTMYQIYSAFKWGKPALINTHRINFVGKENNSAKGRSELKILLDSVVNKWPDVEFLGAGEFAEFLCKSIKSKKNE